MYIHIFFLLETLKDLIRWFEFTSRNVHSSKSEPGVAHLCGLTTPPYYVAGVKENMKCLKSRLCPVCCACVQSDAACPWEGGIWLVVGYSDHVTAVSPVRAGSLVTVSARHSHCCAASPRPPGPLPSQGSSACYLEIGLLLLLPVARSWPWCLSTESASCSLRSFA